MFSCTASYSTQILEKEDRIISLDTSNQGENNTLLKK